MTPRLIALAAALLVAQPAQAGDKRKRKQEEEPSAEEVCSRLHSRHTEDAHARSKRGDYAGAAADLDKFIAAKEAGHDDCRPFVRRAEDAAQGYRRRAELQAQGKTPRALRGLVASLAAPEADDMDGATDFDDRRLHDAFAAMKSVDPDAAKAFGPRELMVVGRPGADTDPDLMQIVLDRATASLRRLGITTSQAAGKEELELVVTSHYAGNLSAMMGESGPGMTSCKVTASGRWTAEGDLVYSLELAASQLHIEKRMCFRNAALTVGEKAGMAFLREWLRANP
jgi:hypothetical protein